MNDTTTPETDKVFNNGVCNIWQLAILCCKLERERNAAQKELEQTKSELAISIGVAESESHWAADYKRQRDELQVAVDEYYRVCGMRICTKPEGKIVNKTPFRNDPCSRERGSKCLDCCGYSTPISDMQNLVRKDMMMQIESGMTLGWCFKNARICEMIIRCNLTEGK